MDKKINTFINRLKEKELTLALAESMTCGLAAHKLSTTPGTAEVLKGSVVCYTPEVKTGLLDVPEKMIEKYTSESMEVTEALARNLSRVIKADIYAAITGLASPGGSETKDKPVGTVFFCIRYRKKLFKEKKLFRGTPLEIRKKACDALYDLILKKIAA
jgi:nicotinamide-nucleotide amidase